METKEGCGPRMDMDAGRRRRIQFQTERVHVCARVEKGEFLSLFDFLVLIFEVGGAQSRCCSWRTIGRGEDKVSTSV